jgi:hypothetical protein
MRDKYGPLEISEMGRTDKCYDELVDRRGLEDSSDAIAPGGE